MAKTIRNLTDQDVLVICEIIDGWTNDSKLTWDSLNEAIEQRLFKKWSRQALDRHARIKNAYKLKTKSLKQGPSSSGDKSIPADLRKALETISRLKSENDRLKMENFNLMETFRRWAYNATAKGITEDILNKPLPNPNRGRTRE